MLMAQADLDQLTAHMNERGGTAQRVRPPHRGAHRERRRDHPRPRSRSPIRSAPRRTTATSRSTSRTPRRAPWTRPPTTATSASRCRRAVPTWSTPTRERARIHGCAGPAHDEPEAASRSDHGAIRQRRHRHRRPALGIPARWIDAQRSLARRNRADRRTYELSMRRMRCGRRWRKNVWMTSLQVGRNTPRQPVLGQLPRMYRADGSPIRALLVDDERALTNLIRMALEYEGWEIDVAHDAEEAVGTVPGQHPRRRRARHHAARHGRARGAAATPRSGERYTPILFLTARDSVHDRVIGLTAGGDDYMTKPFSLEELVARLRGLAAPIGLSHARGTTRRSPSAIWTRLRESHRHPRR